MNPNGVQQLEEGGIITRRSMRAVRAGAVPEPASHEVASVSSQNAILLFWGKYKGTPVLGNSQLGLIKGYKHP